MHYRFFRFFLCFAFMLTLVSTFSYGVSPSIASQEISLIPHRAVYDITLHKISEGSALIDMSGDMSFSLEANCSGWITDHKITLSYDYRDMPRFKMSTHMSSYESYDGDNFQFVIVRKKNNHVLERMKGHAMRGADSVALNSVYPEDKTQNLDFGTYFPMQHTIALLHAAKKGQRYVTLPVFDGSNEEGNMEVSSFITEAKNSPYHVRANEALYKIDLAFFQQKSKTEQPEYEITLYMHESGIITHMLVDYVSFSMTQSLRSLDDLPQVLCRGK